MNISEIEASLPWGLHDAYFEAIEIDWPNARLTLTVRVMMSANQDMDQRAKVVLSGLVFCTFEGSFLNWFFVHQWNSFIHVCARDAEWIWIEAARCRRVQNPAPCFSVRRPPGC